MIKKWILLIMVLLLGFVVCVEASEQNVVMKVEGMTCPLCPLAVKKSLSGIEGVKNVEVSLEEGKAWLTVEEWVTDDKLIEAMKKAGPYKGTIIERKLKK